MFSPWLSSVFQCFLEGSGYNDLQQNTKCHTKLKSLVLHLNLPFHWNGLFRDTITLVFFVLRLHFQDLVKKKTFTHFSADFLFVIPSLLYTDFMMTWMPYLTWILDLAIFRRQKYIFCIFYIFNVQDHLRGSFKDTFTLGLFLFWSSVSKIWSKKQTFTHFSADLLLPVTSLMFKRLMFVISSLLYTDFMMNQMPYLTWILDFSISIFRRQKYIFCIFYIFNSTRLKAPSGCFSSRLTLFTHT